VVERVYSLAFHSFKRPLLPSLLYVLWTTLRVSILVSIPGSGLKLLDSTQLTIVWLHVWDGLMRYVSRRRYECDACVRILRSFHPDPTLP
jgi:hypothetical protein